MREWLLLPVVAAWWMLDVIWVRNVTLLSGAADVLLLAVLAWAVQPFVRQGMWAGAIVAALLMEISSAMPNGVYFFWYLSAVGGLWLLRRRVWQSRFGLYWSMVLISSLLGGIFMYLTLWILQGPAWGNLTMALMWVVLPSTFLNLLWALPVYFLMRELLIWIYDDWETGT